LLIAPMGRSRRSTGIVWEAFKSCMGLLYNVNMAPGFVFYELFGAVFPLKAWFFPHLRRFYNLMNVISLIKITHTDANKFGDI